MVGCCVRVQVGTHDDNVRRLILDGLTHRESVAGLTQSSRALAHPAPAAIPGGEVYMYMYMNIDR